MPESFVRKTTFPKGILSLPSVTRLSGSNLTRGFAPPPHGGFAFVGKGLPSFPFGTIMQPSCQASSATGTDLILLLDCKVRPLTKTSPRRERRGPSVHGLPRVVINLTQRGIASIRGAKLTSLISGNDPRLAHRSECPARTTQLDPGDRSVLPGRDPERASG